MVNWYCCCCFDFLQAACIQSRGWSSRSRTRSSRRSSTRPAVCGSFLARSSSTTTVFVDAVVGVVVVDNHCGNLEMREETENRWNPRDGPCFFFPHLLLGSRGCPQQKGKAQGHNISNFSGVVEKGKYLVLFTCCLYSYAPNVPNMNELHPNSLFIALGHLFVLTSSSPRGVGNPK